MMFRLSLALLRLFSRIVPSRQREAWLQEWESEFDSRRAQLAARHALTHRREVEMFRRVLGSFHDAAWLRRQFTLDADVMHDVRYGARLLRRTPGFTALAVTVLALGIGATTGIYSVVDGLLIRQLPYRDPERIVLLFEAPTNNRTALEAVAPANFIDWQEQARTIEVMAAAEPFGYTYADGFELVSVPGMRVSKGFFDAFGMAPMLGRTFSSDEYTPGRDRVVVLSYGTWAQRFGADRGIVGSTIRLNGQPHTVIGVMPRAFAPRLLTTFSERGLWTPKIWNEVDRQIRGARYYNAVARLKPGVTVEQAQSEVDAIAGRLAEQYPRTNERQTIQLISLRDHLAGDVRSSLVVLSAATSLLLLIAMANTAHLLLARSATRAREISVRSAIGADRGRLMRQLLAETLLLAILGCLVGLLVAQGTTRLIVNLAPADIPALATLGVNGRVLLFSTALTLLVTMLVGMAPAWRGTNIHIADVLSGAAGGTRVAHGGRGRARLVVAELAVALTLLMAAGLLLRSFSSLIETSPGFRPEGVAAVQIFARLPQSTAGQRAAYIQQIIDAMRTQPEVREIGAASVIPFLNTTGNGPLPIVIEGRPAAAPGEEPSAAVNVATPGYFPAMRIARLEGRIFDEHDDGSRAPVAVVSQTFAKQHWRETSPVGEHIQFEVRGGKMRAEIIGVVADIRYESLDRPAIQEVFVPHAQMPVNDMTFVARTSGDPILLLDGLKSRLRGVAPLQAVYRTATMPDLVAQSLNERRFMLALVLGFAALAVALAASGVYGVMTLVSAQRTKEYGLRVALGAGRGEILGMVLREGAVITVVGIAIGLVGALAAGQLLRSFLFGVKPTDPWTLVWVCAALGLVTGMACLLPALRATRVSPLVALRTD
jgi:putative ABC transport system permease protein